MPDKNEMTELHSLQIIQQMINTAKNEQKDDGKGWIIWGWMLLAASIGTIININYGTLQIFFFWNLFGAFSVLFAFFQSLKAFVFKKRVKVKTYTNDIFNKLNTGFFVCLLFIIISMNLGVDPRKGFPLLMNLYAFWILIYGAVLNFKPSIIGAIIMWVTAFVALFFSRTFELVMIIHAVGVIAGYIIPGHIANIEFKKVAGKKLPGQTRSV